MKVIGCLVLLTVALLFPLQTIAVAVVVYLLARTY
jgi:hypothetical protein